MNEFMMGGWVYILIKATLYRFLDQWFSVPFIVISMNKNPGPLLRDIRNIKKNNTITFSITSKELPVSGKDLKKARSSEQLLFKGFLDVLFH